MIVICNLHPQRVLNRWCRASHVSIMSVRTECQWVLKTQLSSTAVLWDEFNISCMRARKEWSLFVLFTSYVTGILSLSTEHTVSHQLEFNTFPNILPKYSCRCSINQKRKRWRFPFNSGHYWSVSVARRSSYFLPSIINYQFQIGRLQTESNADDGWITII